MVVDSIIIILLFTLLPLLFPHSSPPFHISRGGGGDEGEGVGEKEGIGKRDRRWGSLPIIVGRVKRPLSVVPRITGDLPQPIEYPRRWIEPVVRHHGESIHRRRCQIAEWHLTPCLTRNRSCFGSLSLGSEGSDISLSLCISLFLFSSSLPLKRRGSLWHHKRWWNLGVCCLTTPSFFFYPLAFFLFFCIIGVLQFIIYKLIFFIYNNLRNIISLDAPRPWGIYFQNSATPQMEGLIELHDNILFYYKITDHKNT